MTQVSRLHSSNNNPTHVVQLKAHSCYKEKTVEEQYKPYLVSFMNFRDGTDKYTEKTEFDAMQLGSITPEQIVRSVQ